MKTQFRLYRRDKPVKGKADIYYLEDVEIGKRTSLKTRDAKTAERLLHAHCEAHIQPAINLQIARTYVAASDPAMVDLNWREVMQVIVSTKTGETKKRWETVAKDKAMTPFWNKPLVETRAEHFLDALVKVTVSTNVYLRRLHNFALDMNWLLASVLVKKKWPKPI